MFISQINRQFTFGEKAWLLTLTNFPEEKSSIPSATIYIEGVQGQSLLFCRYDIYARPWRAEEEKIPDYLGLLSDIKIIETNRYQASFGHSEMISYQVEPKLCNDLRSYIQMIKEYMSSQAGKLETKAMRELLVRKSCMVWCFDQLYRLRLIF